jgi:thiol-disulfide isomerase/thioredoxin
MKTLHVTLLSILFGAVAITAQTPAKKTTAAPATEMKFRLNGLTNCNVLLAHYYANQNRIVDTGKVDEKGSVVFRKSEAYPGGIYLLVFPSKRFFEVIVADDQTFSIDVADTNEIINNIKVTGSDENEAFYEYQRFLLKEQRRVEPLQNALKGAKDRDKKDSITLLQKQIAVIDSGVKVYRRSYYKEKYPTLFMSKVFSGMDEPDPITLEMCPKKEDGSIDSNFRYRHFKEHYWDGYDWNDERLIRTPVFYNKMKYYLEKLTHPHVDSQIVAVTWIIEKTRPAKEVFKYAISYNTYTYETSKIMGYDKVFVHLVNTYYRANQCWWVGEEQKGKILKRADQLSFVIIGNPAINIQLQDSTGKVIPLQNVKAKYTAVIFWDPTCGHCKTDIPMLKTYYDSLKTAGHSFEVYAVYSELDYKTWRAFVKEKKLNWINVCGKDAQQLGTAKYYYDVHSTPTLVLLDENKKIIAKRFDVSNMKPFLNRRLEEDKKVGTK